jgi:S1-C subfamily serine protease
MIALLLAASLAQNADRGGLIGLEREFVELVEKLTPAVVRVGETFSGVVLDARGYVLTDRAAAEKPREAVEVWFPRGRSGLADVVRADPATGTALLRLRGRGYPFLPPGDSGEVRPGDWALVLGNAFSSAREGQPSVTVGVIAAVRRSSLYLTAAVNPGNEGGPVVGSTGELIGVTMRARGDGDLGQAIPIAAIRAAYGSLDEVKTLFRAPRSRSSRPPRFSGFLEDGIGEAARRVAPCLASLVVKRKPPEPVAEEKKKEEGAAPSDKKEPAPTPPDRSRRPPGLPPPPPTFRLAPRTAPLTAVVVRADGLLVASAHFLQDDVESVEAVLADGSRHPARLLGRDDTRGIALLKVEAEGLAVPELRADPEVGELVAAIGCPFGGAETERLLVSTGVLSNRGRLNRRLSALQTDAAVNPANAGGALVDLRGRVVGILVLAEVETYGINSGVGFALPVPGLLESITGLQAREVVKPGYLGVVTSAFLLPGGGVQLEDVAPETPAAVAGLKKGDVLLSFNGEELADLRRFQYLIRGQPAGTAVRLVVRREGKGFDVTVTLAVRPENP